MHKLTHKLSQNSKLLCFFACITVVLFCSHRSGPPEDYKDPQILPVAKHSENVSVRGPGLTPQINRTKPINTDEIPRFAANSPFDVDYKPPVPKKTKRLWARSCLWEKAPDFVVEKWLTQQPDTKGKYVLIEFWATWCSQSRRAVQLLNQLHSKYKKEMVLIGISSEKEQTVRKFSKAKIEYNVAIDTQARMEKQLAVSGFPHIIIVEPGGHVVWEGFPLLNGYELTEEIVEKILTVGRNAKAKTAAAGK